MAKVNIPISKPAPVGGMLKPIYITLETTIFHSFALCECSLRQDLSLSLQVKEGKLYVLGFQGEQCKIMIFCREISFVQLLLFILPRSFLGFFSLPLLMHSICHLIYLRFQILFLQKLILEPIWL